MFAYDVQQEYSKYRVEADDKRIIMPAYRGLVYIDEDTKMVVKIVMTPYDMPSTFPIHDITSSLDYDFETIGDQQYMLPLKSVLTSKRDRQMTQERHRIPAVSQVRNRIARIKFETPDPLPEDQTKETLRRQASKVASNSAAVILLRADDCDFAVARWTPALEHAFADGARENADHRNPASRRDMPAGRIVADVQAAALDVRGETGERAIPHHDALAAGLRHRALHSLGLFAARAFVDQDRPRQSPQQLRFERIGHAFGWIFADAEADRGGEFGRVQPGAKCTGGLRETPNVSAAQLRARAVSGSSLFGSERSAVEEIVIFLAADRQQTELSKTGVGIDDDAVRQTHGFAQLRPDRKPIIDGSAAPIGDRKMAQTRIGGEQLPAFLADRRTRSPRWESAVSRRRESRW